MTYQLICGAEIHVELKTKSKMFCGCKNDPFHAPKPNIYTCPVCLGMPGALPVANKKAIEDCILIGLALGCKIAKVSKFDRKHYFYPDLPKGYQISQYDEPFCYKGSVDTSFGPVRITRVHMEEDTAKLHHETVDGPPRLGISGEAGKKVSLIDFNRSSVPLVEIVTEPDIHSPEQAKEFLKKVRDIIRTLGVSDCDMEKGSMRLEANISLSSDGKLPNYKVEVKNINSFRYFANALTTEFARHAEILDRGETPIQETRGYRDGHGTVSQRTKEEAADYRYFPDPDIPPIIISDEWLAQIKSRLVQLPSIKINSLIAQGISESAAKIIVTNQVMMNYIEQVKTLDKKLVLSLANDLVNKKIDYLHLTPTQYIKSKSLAKITDESVLKPIIEKILSANPTVVADYKAGKQNVLGFFVGAVMKATSGQAHAQIVNKVLLEVLDDH